MGAGGAPPTGGVREAPGSGNGRLKFVRSPPKLPSDAVDPRRCFALLETDNAREPASEGGANLAGGAVRPGGIAAGVGSLANAAEARLAELPVDSWTPCLLVACRPEAVSVGAEAEATNWLRPTLDAASVPRLPPSGSM
mmetsp:Transcript_9765/g.25618  ORF Transcript_9765/g.25618 Transcript_9765/m.25618 type:complete len:139 (+) Transcript_9765:146-562(+)